MRNDPFQNFDRNMKRNMSVFSIIFGFTLTFIGIVFVATIGSTAYILLHPKQTAAAVGELAGTVARSADQAYKGGQ